MRDKLFVALQEYTRGLALDNDQAIAVYKYFEHLAKLMRPLPVEWHIVTAAITQELFRATQILRTRMSNSKISGVDLFSGDWMPVNRDTPTDTRIMAWHEDYGVVTVIHRQEDNMWVIAGTLNTITPPTAWMPSPATPEKLECL